MFITNSHYGKTFNMSKIYQIKVYTDYYSRSCTYMLYIFASKKDLDNFNGEIIGCYRSKSDAINAFTCVMQACEEKRTHFDLAEYDTLWDNAMLLTRQEWQEEKGLEE